MTATCPKCGWEDDEPEFGFMACESCGFCTHPSRDGDGDGGFVCGICGDVELDPEYPGGAA